MNYITTVSASVAAHSPETASTIRSFLEKDVRERLRQQANPPMFEATFILFEFFEPAIITVANIEHTVYKLTMVVTTTGFLDGQAEILRALPISTQRELNTLYTIVQTTVAPM